MGKLKSSLVLKKYNGKEDLVELYLNFGYKEYNSIKNKHYYKPLRYYTGVRIKKGEWDKTNKLPLDSKKVNELRSLERTAHDIFNYLSKQDETITPDLLRAELDKVIKAKSEAKTVIHIGEYIREVIMLNQNEQRSQATLKNFNKLANKIETFEKEIGVAFTVENLDERLYKSFVDFYRSQFNRINTVWDLCKVLKSVLNEIRRKYKIHVFNPAIELAKSDKVTPRSEDKVYFNFSQIQKIIDYSPPSERLKNTKFILLTLLFSGCRYSDVFKVQPKFTFESKKDDIKFRYARFIDQKTDKDIIVPILDPLEQAYKENNGESPYPISDVKFNKYVKELCELAELTDEVTLSYTDAQGKKQYEVKEFYQFVTSHIGRRSFITNLINFIPITILTKITGHAIRDKSIIFSYNKISLLDNAVLFIKELKRVTDSNPEEFPLRLV